VRDVLRPADATDRDVGGPVVQELLPVLADAFRRGPGQSVAMYPGAIALTVTPNLPSSLDSVLVKPRSPALAAA